MKFCPKIQIPHFRPDFPHRTYLDGIHLQRGKEVLRVAHLSIQISGQVVWSERGRYDKRLLISTLIYWYKILSELIGQS
jgi:hypothetical protein